jgi:nicotinamidase/pyrazinamidase
VQLYGPDTALIVVDVQNDFADPDGALSVPGAEHAVAGVNRAIEAAGAAGAAVVATQDWHPPHTPHFVTDGGPWPVHCVGGTWGADLAPSLELPDSAPRVRKGANGEDGYSGFSMRDPISGDTLPTELDGLLRAAGVSRVVVVGLATDYCVKATALDALRLGFETTVLTDAVAAVDVTPGDEARALDELRAAGVTIRASDDATDPADSGADNGDAADAADAADRDPVTRTDHGRR